MDQEQQFNSNEEVKTFTQEDVNRIVSERLSKEKGKINAEREEAYAKREQELNLREVKIKGLETLSEKGLPKELIDVLNYSDEQSMLDAIDILEKHINKQQGQEQTGRRITHYSPARGATINMDPIREAMGLSY